MDTSAHALALVPTKQVEIHELYKINAKMVKAEGIFRL